MVKPDRNNRPARKNDRKRPVRGDNNDTDRSNANRRVEANEEEQTDFVFGRHAVMETLKTGDQQSINKVFVQNDLNSDAIHDLVKLAKSKKLIVSQVPKSRLDLLSDDGNHQGIMAAIAPYSYATIDDLFEVAKAKNEEPFFLILDNLEDPHNLGSIMRTADAVGVHGIIIPKHRAVGLTSTVAKTSTGAIEHVKVARVTNLASTIKILKERGMWIFGTAMDGQDYRTWDASGSTALVIGNEGKGISPGVAKLMDATMTIPMVGHVQSLNASVAAGVLMYQAFTSRQGD